MSATTLERPITVDTGSGSTTVDFKPDQPVSYYVKKAGGFGSATGGGGDGVTAVDGRAVGLEDVVPAGSTIEIVERIANG